MNGKERIKELGKRLSDNAWFLALPLWGWKIRIKGSGVPEIKSQGRNCEINISQGDGYSEIDISHGGIADFTVQGREFHFASRSRGKRNRMGKYDRATINSIGIDKNSPGFIKKIVGGLCRKRVTVDESMSIRYEE